MATWSNAGRARLAFADLVESLDESQRTTTSLCSEWSAEGVLAHITSFVETGLPTFFSTIARSRFDFDRASVTMANRQLERPIDDVLAALRAKATKSSPIPIFPEEMTLSDVVIHTQDVRRTTGATGSVEPDLIRRTLDFLTTHRLATTLVDRRPIDQVRLVASDLNWSHGDGPEIAGTAEALMMALANRPVLDELGGPGLSTWT